MLWIKMYHILLLMCQMIRVIKRLRRVTGYLTSDYHEAFNLGKQQEVDMRVKHTGVSVN